MGKIERFFDLSLDLLCIAGPDGYFKRVNPAFSRVLGYSEQELLSQPFVEFVHPDDRLATLALLEEMEAGAPAVDFENRYRCKDGSWRWLAWRATPVLGDGLIYAVARDVTERRSIDEELRQARDELEHRVAERTIELAHANQELRREIAERERLDRAHRASERRFETIAEVSPVGILQTTPSAECVYANRRWCQISGRTLEQTLGQGWIEAVHPEDRPRIFQARDALTPEVRSFRVEFRVVRPDGKSIWVLGDATAEVDDEGEIVAVIGTVTDISEQMEAALALFKEKERAQVTLHSIGEGVITTDAEGVVEYLNPVAEAMTGWPLAEARGRPLEEVFHLVDEQSRERVADPVALCLEEGRIDGLAEHSLLIGRSGNEIAIQDSAAPIRGPGTEALGVVLVFNDVTESRDEAQKMAYQATHDSLTGLVNRREFERRQEQALAAAREHDAQHALCYLDLDHFKTVNDTAGHVAGDEMLRQLAALLRQQVRARDTLARLGGDEFGLLLGHCPLTKAEEIAQGLVAAVRDFRFAWEGETFRVGVSVGVVPINAGSGSTHEILRRADRACYAAKSQGPNRVHVERPEEVEVA